MQRAELIFREFVAFVKYFFTLGPTATFKMLSAIRDLRKGGTKVYLWSFRID